MNRRLSIMGLRFILASILLLGAGRAQEKPKANVPEKLSLDQATEILLVSNPTILRERQNIEIARADLAGARLIPNPELDISSESYPLFESSPGAFFQNSEDVVRVGQPIETAGKRTKRTRVAEQDVAVAQSLLQDAVRQMKLELRTRYYRVVLAKSEYELASEVLGQFDEIIRLNEARLKQGDVSTLDVARVQTERSRFFNDLVTAEVQLRNEKTSLLELLGAKDVNAQFDVSETLTFTPLTASVDELAQSALAARPDLRARQQVVEREKRDLTLEKANAYPNVTPFFGYKRDFAANTVAFGVNVSLPVFNRNQGGIARAAARANQAGFEREQAELAVRSQVSQAYQVVQGEERRVQGMQDVYVPKARQARDIAQGAYRLGALNLIAFLDAERSYRETLRNYNEALFNHQVAVFVLEAAIGKEQ